MQPDLILQYRERKIKLFNPISTGTGLNQPLHSYHVTQAGRNRVKCYYVFVIQNVFIDINDFEFKLLLQHFREETQ